MFLDIIIKNNNIILKNGKETIEYWGEQGVSPSESFKKLNAISSGVADAKEIITTSPGTETPWYDETDGIWDLSIGAEQ